MKPKTNMVLTAALVLGMGLAIGCNSQSQSNAKAVQTANLQSVTFFVDGMVWGTSWTTAVEKQLKELPGVAEATTDMDLQTATIKYDPALLKPEDAIDSFTGRFQLSIYEGEIE